MQPTLRQDDFMERAMRIWGSTVYRLALNQTQSPHDADDVCQDVFLRLLKDATVFKDDEHLKAWLLCVTINCCRDLHRSAWKRRAELTDTIPDATDEDPCGDSAVRALRDSDLGRALGRLPGKMRLIVHLYYYEGYSTEEIARLVHCAPATVRTRLRRARTQLGHMLGKEASFGTDRTTD
ncbi:UNVERIFIED_ORG: RNA polymerase sigma factor, sigma-70 family protein [Clostridioides difficile F501]